MFELVSSADPCVDVCLCESALHQICSALNKKTTTIADQIAFSKSVSLSWSTVGGFLQLFDTGKIYSTAGMKTPQAGLRRQICNKMLIAFGQIAVTVTVSASHHGAVYEVIKNGGCCQNPSVL